ncbi:MAG: porin family protein [Edaphocola sp.]
MKKLILVAAGALLGTSSFAQVSINPEFGVNFAKMPYEYGSINQPGEAITGLKGGVMIDFGLSKGFFFQPGVMFSIKGNKTTYSLLGVTTVTKTTIQNLEIPINLGYRCSFGKAGSAFATVGPYAGLGMSGKSKAESGGVSIEGDITFGDDAGDVKKLDYGVNFGLGYATPMGIYIRGQYGMGLANLSNVDNATSQNRVWSVSVGYAFAL